MRKSTKRIASLTCAAALVFSLAACSTTAASTSTSDITASSGVTDGTPPDGQPPEKPDGAPGDAPGGQGGPSGGFGGSGTVTQGTSANTLDSDTSIFSTSYTSTGDDENALRVDGATVTLQDVTVSKSSGSSSNTEDGDLFYITNTHSVITLSGVTLKNEDSSGNLMTIAGNSASHGWGTAGSNGAQVELTADAQTLEGNITVDTISTLDLTLKNNSTFTGTINIVDNAEGGTAVDNNAVVTIEKGSTWTLTGDCTITSLTNNGTINFNGHTITLADGTVLK